MVNAPPTPPPTTSAEIQEAAQAQASASRQQEPASVQQPSQGPDPYQIVFPALVQAAARGDYVGLSARAEEVDLTAFGDHLGTRLLVVAPLVVSNLIQDQIQPARHALERLPDNLSNAPLTELLKKLTTVTYNRLHPQVYETVTTLLALVGQPDFFDKELGLILTTLLSQFADAFRRRTFQLLSRAYSSLPLSLAQEYLGVPAEAIINEANQHGWTYESSTQTLVPRALTLAEAPKACEFETIVYPSLTNS